MRKGNVKPCDRRSELFLEGDAETAGNAASPLDQLVIAPLLDLYRRYRVVMRNELERNELEPPQARAEFLDA